MAIKAIGSTRVININDGAPGSQGVSVTQVTPQFYLSTSNTELVGGQWSDTRPAVTSGHYLWTRNKTDLSNNTSTYSNPVYDETITDLVFDVDSLNNEISTKVSTSDFHTMITEDTTIQTISTQASNAEQTASGLSSRVSSVESTLTTKADGSTVTALQSSVSEISQKADRIDLVITSDSTQSSVEMTDAALSAIATYINLNGVVQFSGLSNTAVRTLSAGGLLVYYDSQADVNTTEEEDVYTDENDDVIGDDIVRLIFANDQGEDGWVFFQNQKVTIPRFTVDLYLDKFSQKTGLIVYRQTNQTPYVVWKELDQQGLSVWRYMNLQDDPAVYYWTWQSATDVILCEWTKDENAHVSYTCYYPAKSREDIRSFDFLTRIAYDNAVTDSTTINGGLIESHTIIANALYVETLSSITANIGELTSGVIRSSNYAYTSGDFADNGLKIDLTNATISSKNFAVDINGDAHFKGDVTATSLTLGSGVTVPYTSVSGRPDLTVYIAKDGTIGSTPASGATGFKVSSAGLLQASNAVIYGTIYASAGEIGGFTIDGTSIHTKNIAVTSNASGSVSFSSADFKRTINGTERSGLRFAIGSNFGVSNTGVLYASGVVISGTVTASNGTIGGWKVTSDAFSKTVTIDSTEYRPIIYAPANPTTGNVAFGVGTRAAGSSDSYTYPFIVRYSGAVTATNITATGGAIGGFALDSTSLHTSGVAVTSNASNSLALSSSTFTRTINGTSRASLKFAIGSNFGVSNTGVLYAGSAVISGSITASSGKIGGYTISSTSNTGTTSSGGHAYTTSFYGHSGDGTYEYEVGMKSDASSTSGSGNLAFYVKRITAGAAWSTAENVFYVTHAGVLMAKSANITGTITATSGTIGGWTIGSTSIYYKTNSMTSTTTGTYIGTDGFYDKYGDYFVKITKGCINAYNIGVDLRGHIIVGYSQNSTTDLASIYTQITSNRISFVYKSTNAQLGWLGSALRGSTYYADLDISGNAYVGGNVVQGSDERRKNINPINQNIEKFMLDLEVIEYTWKEHEDDTIHVGLGAQRTENLLEQYGLSNRGLVIHDSERDTYGIAYAELAPMMLPTVQKTYRKTEELERRIVELESELNKLKSIS